MTPAEILTQLRDRPRVDLTHAFAPGIPHYAAFPDEERESLPDLGFTVHRYAHVGQWGTHVDPPSHFVEGGMTVDEIGVEEMLLELVVLDARAHVEADRGYAADAALVEAHEAEHGTIPAGSFVALNTGWHRLWPDAGAMAGGPGWDVSALQLLVEQRGVTAIGHDTTDTDPGRLVAQGEVPAEDWILRAGRWQIELLANLDALPARGAVIVAAWPKPEGGSGFPARCFAII